MTTTYREKAREIKAAGEAKRGDFEPTGVPLRMYDYWLRQSNSKRARQIRWGDRTENFCHFWRVVAIWAPMRALLNAADKAFPFVLGAVVLAALVTFVWALFFADGFILGLGYTLVAVVIGALGIAGFLSGIALAIDADSRKTYDLPNGKFMWASVILAAPMAIPMYLIAKAIQGMMWAFSNHEKTSLAVTLGLFATFAFGSIGLAGGLSAMVLALAGTLTVGAVSIGLTMLFAWLSTYVEGKREIDKEKFNEFLTAYSEAHGKPYVAPARKPSKVKAFLRGAGDFIILIGQVVRVNKWKICPTVSIETKRYY